MLAIQKMYLQVCNLRISPFHTGLFQRCRQQRGISVRAATDDDLNSVDVKELANFISAQPLDDEREQAVLCCVCLCAVCSVLFTLEQRGSIPWMDFT